jgi:hypothetical protein
VTASVGYLFYFYYHGLLYQYFIVKPFIADREVPLFVGFFDMHYQSIVYLFKIDEKTWHITSENRI